MSRDLKPSLKSLALQIALQLPDDQKEAVSILQRVREIVECDDPKKGHALRTSGINVAGPRRKGHSSRL